MASEFVPPAATCNGKRPSYCQFCCDKFAAVARPVLCVLIALSPVPCAHAQADAQQKPVVIAAGPSAASVSQQVRADQVRQELNNVREMLKKQKNLPAEERTLLENKRDRLQAELAELVPNKKQKPQTAKAKE